MSSEIIDLQARSREGRGLSQKAGERWIEIQKNTFVNWVNLQLEAADMSVVDMEADFDNGVRLCLLVEALQHRKIGRVIKKPMNQHQSLENVTLALRAIADDNVRLVNIGSEDIVNGSVKLILGLVWRLILRYQIGKTKFPPKRLMLAWLHAVVPECHITNFTSDWNDGVALHALCEYCQPGLCPDWRKISRSDRLENCTNGMEMAKDNLNIPMVVRPQDLSSPHMDELSGMTYLSYFMKVDSPGYFATRREIRALLQHGSIDNFTTDWNDGRLLCNLVMSVGGQVPGWPGLSDDHVQNLQSGIDAAKSLGVEPIFSAKEISDPEVEHLGVMAYAAYFRQLKPVTIQASQPTFDGHFNDVHVNQERVFVIHAEGKGHSDIRAEVQGPDSSPHVRLDWSGDTASGYFTPVETGQHTLNVFCEGIHIARSPVSFKVHSDRSKVRHDHLERAVVGMNSELKVDTTNAGDGEIRIETSSPSGRLLNLPVMYKNGIHTANLLATEVGQWQVNVHYEGEPIPDSPYMVPVIDPSLVRILSLEGGKAGDENVFYADASAAGDGQLRIEVLHDSWTVPSTLVSEGAGRYKAQFTPHAPGTYTVHVYMDDIETRGSPYDVQIIDTTRVTVSGEGLNLVPIHKPAIFTIHTHGAGGGKVDVDITDPSDHEIPFNMASEGNGDRMITYTPVHCGLHTISVKYSDKEIADSPLHVKAFDVRAIVVSPLKDGFVNQPLFFTIDVAAAGEGQIQIMVNNGRIPNTVEETGDSSVYRIKFTPLEAGPHQVEIKFNDLDLPASPLTCMVRDLSADVSDLNHLVPVMEDTSFRITPQGPVGEEMGAEVKITAPNGDKIPAMLKLQQDGDYKVEWTPASPGRHSVDVLYAGSQIQGSPFYIDVFDIHKIRVNNFYNGNVGEKAGFRIDCTQAGHGHQEIRITSPTGRNVPFDVEEPTPLEYHVSYLPTEVGLHKVSISYSGMDLNGSPFHQEIFEGQLPPATGDGLHRGEEDKPAIFVVDGRGMTGEPTVQVDGPNSIAKCSIDPLPDGQYRVTYIPVEVGLFNAQVRWNGKEIPGSPFHPKIVDPRKVRVVGGWQHYMDSQERIHLVVGEEKQIPFDTADAGPGHLRAEVKSPSAFIPVAVDDEQKGKSVVKFVPKEEGNHYIHLYWSDHPLVNSPYLGYATSGVADPSKVWLSGRGLKEAIVREEAEFVIDGSQAGPGEPEVTLTGVRAEISVFTTPLGGGKYRCTYIPIIPGAYLLQISWNGRQLRGAPYKVNVIGASYPERVLVNGEGLKGGLLGHSLDFRIDTRKAGPGELTAYCQGPNKVAYCELIDHHDGTYRLAVRAQEVGLHALQIKYGGENVQGSPFQFKVSAQPDASKVRVSGPGVEHGILANFQSQFIVETKGAGAGQLTVRIRGPKGAFQVEMYRESQKDRTILCRYYPSVTGLYIIHVRWSGVDVPGSPFQVQIMDTQRELEQVLQDHTFSNHNQHHQNQNHSFHNTSLNHSNASSNYTMATHHNHSHHHQQHQHQNQHQQHHHPNHTSSRTSGYYQWREDGLYG